MSKVEDIKKVIGKVTKEKEYLNIMISTNIVGKDFKYSNNMENLDKLYEIGSSSKMFTALSIFLLDERKDLSIEDPISKYLHKEICEKLFINNFDYSNVKIKTLLNHTSGIGEHLNSGDDMALFKKFNNSKKNHPLKELINLSKENKILTYMPVNKQFQYSNIGYMLLGKIIENVTKENYKQFIIKNILEVLGMENTTFIGNNNSSRELIQGHFRGEKANMPSNIALSAGEMISNLEDMLIFLKGVFDCKIVSKETLDIILKSIENSIDASMHYGFGFYNEKNLIGHGGQTLGFYTKAFYLKKDKKYFILSFNEAESGEISKEIIDIIFK
ncbi:MAG: serine hydrolase domain-containing protein [Psychrilyobacter sp.]|uniref:serine hydrolase domain-containing protein n=1 Tax=Psychrilyobacter sp. TaxID=2586924 RepID=UPI003C779FAA